MMQQQSNSVFISYRRSASGILVLAIYQYLTKHNIDSFYDIESIKAGQFGEIILGQIAARPYFIPVFAPGSLDRCVNDDDWLRKEIELAISLNRVLIPLYTPDFAFSDLDHYLPHLATTILSYNMVKLPIPDLQWFHLVMQDVVENFLEPITFKLTPIPSVTAAEISRVKAEIAAVPPVTEAQFTAQDYFSRALANTIGSSEAIADYTAAIQLMPNFVEAFSNRGNCYYAQENFDAAIADYSQAINLSRNDEQLYFSRGAAWQMKGQDEKALEDYAKVIQLNPAFDRVYNNRGIILAENGDINGAFADFGEAIKLNAYDAEAYASRERVWDREGQVDDAISDYTRAIQLKSDNADLYVRRGVLLKKSGNLDDALNDYIQAIRLRPDFLEAYLYRIEIYEAKGDSRGAMVDTEKALKLMKLVWDKDEARYSEGIEREPNRPDLYYYRGNTRVNKDDFEGAIEDYSKAIRLSPKFAEAYYNRGYAYGSKGDIKKAVADQSKATLLDCTLLPMPYDPMTIVERKISVSKLTNTSNKLDYVRNFLKRLKYDI